MDVISFEKYAHSLELILNKISIIEFDAIVCIKRSGFIMGAFLSNKLDKPLFTQSEITSIPKNFNTILIVDDKIQTGKTIKKIKNRIKKVYPNLKTITASLFIEGDLLTDFYVYKLNKRIRCWYE